MPNQTDMSENAYRASVFHTAGQVGAGAAMLSGDTAATDALLVGTVAVRKQAERLLRVASSQSKGNLFEYIEAAKFDLTPA